MNRPSTFNLKRYGIYLWIGLGWLCIWFLTELARNPDTYQERFINNLWRIVYLVAVNILLFEHIIPSLSRRRIFRSLLMIVGLILLYSVGLYIWRSLGIGLHIYTQLVTYPNTEHAVGAQFATSLSSLLIFAILKHIYDYIKLRRSARQLRIEKQEAELNYLKSQTNPHFLFNTLNNIYSLSREKSDLAPESIMRLSQILRYMLYEAGGAHIAIEQELKIISDYIELEKLRYDESLIINFSYDVEDMKQSIPPLLLMPLVENAFKHGISETRNRPFLDIHLTIRQRQLKFVVRNSAEGGSSTIKENIGLANLRRQLELQFSDYMLDLQPSPSQFIVSLTINLASHV